MRFLFRFFESNKAQEKCENKALLSDQHDFVAVPFPTAMENKLISTKKFFTDIADSELDKIILRYFAVTVLDVITFKSLSKSLSEVAWLNFPLPSNIIGKSFSQSKHEQSLIIRSRLKIATVPALNALTTKKLNSIKDVDVALLEKFTEIVATLTFKTDFSTLVSMPLCRSIVITLFFSLTLLLLFTATLRVELFKVKNDVLNCNWLLPNMSDNTIPEEMLDQAKKWIQRNNPRINSTAGIIAFCHHALGKYCSNYFKASQFQGGIFDSELGANVACDETIYLFIAAMTLLVSIPCMIYGRYRYINAMWGNISEKEIADTKNCMLNGHYGA